MLRCWRIDSEWRCVIYQHCVLAQLRLSLLLSVVCPALVSLAGPVCSVSVFVCDCLGVALHFQSACMTAHPPLIKLQYRYCSSPSSQILSSLLPLCSIFLSHLPNPPSQHLILFKTSRGLVVKLHKQVKDCDQRWTLISAGLPEAYRCSTKLYFIWF